MLLWCELLAATNMVKKLYYEEILDEKLRSPSKLQALTNKAMGKVQKDDTFAFTKHLPICDPTLGVATLALGL